MLMMEEKADQCSLASYIYHSVGGLFDDLKLHTVFKRRIDIEPLLPSLFSSCTRRRPMQGQGLLFRDCMIAAMQ